MASGDTQPEEVESPDIHFEPLVTLQKVDVVTLEEDEDELIELGSHVANHVTSSAFCSKLEEVEELVDLDGSACHMTLLPSEQPVKPEMELKPNCGSDRAWVWATNADFSDEEAKPELLAIRFANAENAQKFKEKFTEAQEIMKESIPKHNASMKNGLPEINGEVEAREKDSEVATKSEETENKTDDSKVETDKVADKLESLTVQEKTDKSDTSTDGQTTENATDDDKLNSPEKD